MMHTPTSTNVRSQSTLLWALYAVAACIVIVAVASQSGSEASATLEQTEVQGTQYSAADLSDETLAQLPTVAQARAELKKAKDAAAGAKVALSKFKRRQAAKRRHNRHKRKARRAARRLNRKLNKKGKKPKHTGAKAKAAMKKQLKKLAKAGKAAAKKAKKAADKAKAKAKKAAKKTAQKAAKEAKELEKKLK
jgi:hypothetical protein